MDNELYHYQIKGAKHGQRRWQYPDGSLTPAGKIRYALMRKKGRDKASQNETSNGRAKQSNTADDKTNEAAKQAAIEERKKQIIDADDPKLFYKNRAMFTTDEINAARIRFAYEKDIKDLLPKDVSKGQQFVDSFNKHGKNINDVADTGVKLWNNFARIYNATPAASNGHKLPRING